MHCEDCGVRVYNGLCPNCNEEAYIQDNQLNVPHSEEWRDKVSEDRKQQKKRLKNGREKIQSDNRRQSRE